MDDYGLISIELIRSKSRYMEAERSLAAAQAELKVATDDLWDKMEAVASAGHEMADALRKRPPGPPTPSRPLGHGMAA